MTSIRARLRYENELIRLFEGKGYGCLRSGGSRGPADVMRLCSKEVRLIQVKSTKQPLESHGALTVITDGIQEIQQMAHPPNSSRWLYVRKLRVGWYAACVDEYPTERSELREQVRKLVRKWKALGPASAKTVLEVQ